MRSGIIGIGNTNSFTVGKFPSGHITNVFLLSDTSANMSTTANSGSPVIACTPFSFSAISGRKYSIHGSQFIITSNESGSAYTDRIMEFDVYYGTTSRSINDTTVDTRIFKRDVGRNQSSSTTAGLAGYMDAQYTAYFTAGSTATHYIYTTICNANSNGTKNYAYNTASLPHNLIIYEIMP